MHRCCRKRSHHHAPLLPYSRTHATHLLPLKHPRNSAKQLRHWQTRGATRTDPASCDDLLFSHPFCCLAQKSCYMREGQAAKDGPRPGGGSGLVAPRDLYQLGGPRDRSSLVAPHGPTAPVQLSVGARRPISAAGARLLWRSLSSKKIQKRACPLLLFAVYRRL